MRRKTLQELTIKSNYMFGAVMSEEDNCRRFLEMTLGLSIAHLKVDKEKSIVYHPEQKGIRLDVYAKDEKNTRYNVEMQVVSEKNLPKRSRYYHSQIDMDILPVGTRYEELPDCYVIFVCDFDPFGAGRYCYTFANRCLEDDRLVMTDGCYTVFLSTQGENEKEISEELLSFLNYVGAEDADIENLWKDPFVEQLQRTICEIKSNREMEERYMLFEELLMDEREAGREEGREAGRIEGQKKCIFDLLEEFGIIPEKLRNRIEEESNPEVLKGYLIKAGTVTSVEQFQKQIDS